MKKSVDKVLDIWYIINALWKSAYEKSSLKTEQNVNLSS